jgi:pimeloyl-ACP methyl ester carboxylesterase
MPAVDLRATALVRKPGTQYCGAMLNTIITGTDTARPPLLIAHGLFGSARNWGVIARRLAEDRKVVSVDMRNHGESFRADDHGYGDLAADLAEVIATLGTSADVLGHSMGGKAAMRLALEHPDAVRRLVVADIAPVAYGHSQSHLIHAMRGLDLVGLTSRGEADRRLAATVVEDGVRAFLLQSLDLRVDPPRWRLNLDALEAEMDGITGWEAVTSRFDGPVLVLAGALSDYVTEGHRAVILEHFPQTQIEVIDGAGHWLHAERPREFEAAVAAFLD